MPAHEQGPGITVLLTRIRGGDRAALDALLPLVYSELHRLAADQLHRDYRNLTLQPTALINETFLRLFGSAVPSFHDRAHFLGIVSRVMRQVLVDHARKRHAEKRGHGLQVSLENVLDSDVFRSDASGAPASPGDPFPAPGRPGVDLLEIDQVLEKLGRNDPHLLSLIEMRFFGGMTAEETAEALGESVNVVRHNIRYALACLRRDLQPGRAGL